MATGTVKWFNDEKGYGFITPDEGDRDLFVHHTGINGSGFKTLQENSKVSYDEESGDKGPKAVNVTTIRERARDARAFGPGQGLDSNTWRRKSRSIWTARSRRP